MCDKLAACLVLRGKFLVSSFKLLFWKNEERYSTHLGEKLSRIWRGRRQRITSGTHGWNLKGEL